MPFAPAVSKTDTHRQAELLRLVCPAIVECRDRRIAGIVHLTDIFLERPTPWQLCGHEGPRLQVLPYLQADYCLAKPHRFAVTLLSQHPVDMHMFIYSPQASLHFGALL